MINFNHSDIYSTAVDNTRRISTPTEGKVADQSLYQSGVAQADTVTISDQARAMADGEPVERVQNTYDSLAALSRVQSGTIERLESTKPLEEIAPVFEYRGKIDTNIDNFLSDAMSNIVEGRLGIDKERLKEIEAMMEEVAKNENLSPEQKEKKLEELQELLEKEVEKAAERMKDQPVT
ncbi:hypothetical protein [Psychrobium sp. 1_MG-2023]|uniref:hypothetical protein n=1 Tax=Psychrobium sp. 1_MG-2023 TaxID=3062624 RepID=UPI000C328AAD|nr:hypothetical protein [Psychrobium sp. 1_MG-2023]MDP2562804.1 hypothetical protein [Psychrobium sp. 1_MG-2023]PKF54447.1 hypothetical protein CW748_15875 [Alteromonadales bacterium alter-6D02]